MRILNTLLARWPAIRIVLPLAIAMVVAACTPGAHGSSGYWLAARGREAQACTPFLDVLAGRRAVDRRAAE